MQASIKLFKMNPDNLNPDNRVYRVGVISRLGEKAFSVHDSAGVPHFMRLRRNHITKQYECAIDLRHENIPTNDGKVLAVEGMIRSVPIRTQTGTFMFDHRLHVFWVKPERLGNRADLDGSFMDARGYRYFASTRMATEWMFSYLIPILQKSNDFLVMRETTAKMEKEEHANLMARLYSAANGDNYGPEYDVPPVTQGPHTWWASLPETEKYRIFREHEGK